MRIGVAYSEHAQQIWLAIEQPGRLRYQAARPRFRPLSAEATTSSRCALISC